MTKGDAAVVASERRGLRATWLLFAPPIVAASVHWWLTALSDKNPAPVQVMRAAEPPASGVSGVLLQASLPFLLAFAAFALAVLLVGWGWRKWGRSRMTPVLTALWILLWSGAALALGYRYLDRTDRQTLPEVAATVLQASAQEATSRHVSGAKVLLRVSGYPATQSVFLEEADANALRAGTGLTLSVARGRFGGTYVTGWRTSAS